MNTTFKTMEPEAISENVFKLIGKDWMLISAGTIQKYNTMTASWGGLGVLWNKKVCFCVIRPQRYTYQFMEKADTFSLTFFTENHRSALAYCGAHSGRDVDKAKENNLTALEIAPGVVSFAEARLVIVCQKLYYQDIDPTHFIDPLIADLYPQRDFHRMYIGEITGCWSR